MKKWLWATPVVLFWLYVMFFGYPIFITLVTATAIFGAASGSRLIAPRDMYVAGIVMLAFCPFWLIVDQVALLGQNFVLLRMAYVWHMMDATAMARICGDAAFIFFLSGAIGEASRLRTRQSQ